MPIIMILNKRYILIQKQFNDRFVSIFEYFQKFYLHQNITCASIENDYKIKYVFLN